MTAEFHAEARDAFAAVAAAGDAPARWTLTSALYEHLENDADHNAWRIHAKRAYLGYEQPRPYRGIPVDIEAGAHHGWTLHTAGGREWDRNGPVTYSNTCGKGER